MIGKFNFLALACDFRLAIFFFKAIFNRSSRDFISPFFGILFLYIALIISQPILEAYFGLFISVDSLSYQDMILLVGIVFAGMLMGLIPAIKAYRQSLADGMTVRL